jgi:hypothetical protein
MTSLFLSHHRRTNTTGASDRTPPPCRRCAVLYPLAFAVALASLSVCTGPRRGSHAAVLLPLPVTLEFAIERFGGVGYRPWRQVA